MTARLVSVAGACSVSAAAWAQEAFHVPAPTQPAPGAVVARASVRATQYSGGAPEGDPDVARDGMLLEEQFRLAIGITGELSVEASLPLFQGFFDAPAPGQAAFDDDPIGIGDVDLSLKLRIFKEDLGPVDTVRVALFAGTDIPTATDGFGNNDFDPQAGITAMAILGRHGVTGAVSYRFVDGASAQPLFAGSSGADVVSFGAAYLYRLDPETFTEVHQGAWYLTCEALGTAETNGDVEIALMPGLLYEGQRFAFEAAVAFPVIEDLRYRATNAFAVSVGVRILF